MTHCYPDDYQSWLFEALKVEPGLETSDTVLEPIYALNRQWVKGGEELDYTQQHALMRAYTCYYMTINMPKLWAVMDHAPDMFIDKDEIRVVEFGCGPGTFLWAFLFYLSKRRAGVLSRLKSLRGVDRSPVALEYAQRMADVLKKQSQFSHIDISFEESEWYESRAKSDEVVIFGNVLNETLPPTFEWSAFDAAAILIVEPGTCKSFHPLLSVRDALVANGWYVQFPCPTADTPCPMAADNWCHFAINRFQLPFIQRMSNHAKRLNPRHNFSAFLFTRAPAAVSNGWRCLSRLRKANRSGIRWICNGENLVEAVLSRKNRRDANRPFLDAQWGDLLGIDFESSNQFLHTSRIGRNDQVKR